MMLTRRPALSLALLTSGNKIKYSAIALATAAAGYVGVVTYRWQRKYRENMNVKWSRTSVFASGVVLGIVTMATGPILRRWSCPRPDIVLKSVLPQLRANNEVRDLIGSSLQPGTFRAYTYDGGFKWSGVKWSGVKWGGLKWSGVKWGRVNLSLRNQKMITLHPYTLQLLFQVHGEISSAMVSLSVRNNSPWRRGLIYDSLIIDLPNGERMALKGNISHTVIQSYKTRLS